MAERFVHANYPAPSLSEWGTFARNGTQLARPATPTEPYNPGGTVTRGQFDDTQLDLITFDSANHSVTRTLTHVHATPKRHIFSVMLAGHSTWSPEPPTAPAPLHLNTNRIGYWTSEVPYRWDFTQPFTLLTLRTPYEAIDIPHTTLSPLVGTAIEADRGIAQYLIPFTEQILRDSDLLTTATGTRLITHVVGLFATLLAGELTAQSSTDLTQPSFHRVTEYLSAHLHESLPLSSVAHENDMSARYIQSLFQRRGTTLSSWLKTQRLSRARELLADPTLRALGIGAIAHQCGFADHGHFTRSFRSMYCESPSEWRTNSITNQGSRHASLTLQ